MTASYPGAKLSWTNRVDLTDDAVAADVNIPAAEVIAIEDDLIGTGVSGGLKQAAASFNANWIAEHSTAGLHTVDTISEKTSAHGVTVDGVNLKDGVVSSSAMSGTYTPTLYNITNVAASTPETCWWIRVGNNIMVGGTLWIDPTAATTSSLILMTLPVASNFATNYDAGGSMGAMADAYGVGAICASAADDLVYLTFYPSGAANNIWGFTFMYTVI